jgi:HK97 family phage prohead protease/HK97 family phage major capsid protein
MPALTLAHPQPRTPFVPGMVVRREAAQTASDPFLFTMATDTVDRMGDIVDIGGIDLAGFSQNPIALWNHDPDSPIGSWSGLVRKGGALTGKLELAPEGTSSLIDRIRKLIELRIIRAVSIGFRALKALPIETDGRFSGFRFTESELLEASVVSIPANPEALRIKGVRGNPLDHTIFAALGAMPDPGAIGAPKQRDQRGQPPPPTKPRSGVGTMPRTIAEKIVDHQQRVAAIDDQVATITQAAANDADRDFTADEDEQIATLVEEKKRVIRSIDTLTDMEASMALRARPMGDVLQLRVPAQAAQRAIAGEWIGKMAAIAALAHLQRRNPVDIIAERYRDDERIKDVWDYTRKTAAGIADTTTPGWAKELIRQDVAAFLDDLVNVSVFAALRARPSSFNVTFDGAGSVSIPMRTGKGNLAGAWVGEAGVIPVLQGSVGAVTLSPTKLAGITTFSKELMNATNDQIETVLRNGVREDTADMLDHSLLSNQAARAGVRPAGLLNGVTPVASTGNDPQEILDDIAAAVGPIIAAGGGRDIVLIMNPMHVLRIGTALTLNGTRAFPEIDQGRIGNYPVIASLNVPVGTMVALDCAAFASAAGAPDYMVSEEATLTMANADATAPTQSVKADGTLDVATEVGPDLGIAVKGGPSGAGTAGAVAMSMFQQWSLALRLVLPVSWAMRRAGMVGAVTGIVP